MAANTCRFVLLQKGVVKLQLANEVLFLVKTYTKKQKHVTTKMTFSLLHQSDVFDFCLFFYSQS